MRVVLPILTIALAGGISIPSFGQRMWDRLEPVHIAIRQRDFGKAATLAQDLLRSCSPQSPKIAEDFTALGFIARLFPEEGSSERDQLLREMLAMLDRIEPSDHPRAASAIHEMVKTMIRTGFAVDQIGPLIDREEAILSTTKEQSSLTRSDAWRQRAELFALQGENDLAAAELRRVVERAESLAGPHSYEKLGAMKELAKQLSISNDNWPEEERLRLAIIEWITKDGEIYALSEMVAIAERYRSVGDRDNWQKWRSRIDRYPGIAPGGIR